MIDRTLAAAQSAVEHSGNAIDGGSGDDYIAAGTGDDVAYGGSEDDDILRISLWQLRPIANQHLQSAVH